MKLKTKYILFIVVLHVLCLVMSYMIFEQHKVVFIISELLIICSVLLAINLYRQLIQPLTNLKEGINAIQDRDFNVKFRPTGKQEMDELIAVYNQMMDALREERTKQQAQHFFLEKLIQTSPTGIVILDFDHQVKQINPKAIEILGDDPGLFLSQLIPLKSGESKTIRIGAIDTYKFQKSNFIDRGFSRVFVMIEEVTAEIFEAEKNVYSKVIRMMAHEVNNTIGPVNSILNQALSIKDLWQGENRASLKNALQVAVDRNQNLNLFMRNFADLVKLAPVNKSPVNMVRLVQSVTDFMELKAQQQEVNFDLEMPAEPFFIHADEQQMEQVLINIIKNAIEAIEADGSIRISLNPSKKH